MHLSGIHGQGMQAVDQLFSAAQKNAPQIEQAKTQTAEEASERNQHQVQAAKEEGKGDLIDLVA